MKFLMQLNSPCVTFSGKWTPLRSIIKETGGFLEHLAKDVTADDITDKIYCRWASGGDGSGRHSPFRSCKTDAGQNNQNLMLGGAACLIITNALGKKLYEEPSLGSTTEFPHYLIPGKEEDKNVREIMKKYTAEKKDLEANHVQSEIFGKQVTIVPTIEFCQADAKWLKQVCQLSGKWF